MALCLILRMLLKPWELELGSDNLYHKRKAKNVNELKRQKESKSEYKTILIVCEGKKTEPLYFREMIADLKLNTANISVEPSDSTCPLNLVRFAQNKALEEDYDLIYCVFDKDSHYKYSDALNLIRGLGARYIAANSVPCFEYWLLLHFGSSSSSFYGGSKSPGDEAVNKLKKKIPGYKKSQTGIYSKIKAKTDVALANAKKANSAAAAAGTDDPSTQVNILVSELLKIRSEMEA